MYQVYCSDHTEHFAESKARIYKFKQSSFKQVTTSQNINHHSEKKTPKLQKKFENAPKHESECKECPRGKISKQLHQSLVTVTVHSIFNFSSEKSALWTWHDKNHPTVFSNLKQFKSSIIKRASADHVSGCSMGVLSDWALIKWRQNLETVSQGVLVDPDVKYVHII